MNLEKVAKIKFFLLLLTFIVLPFGYFARVNLGSIFLGLYYWDIFILGYAFLFLSLEAKTFFVYKNKLPFYYALIFAFLIYAVLTTINSYRYLDSMTELLLSSLYLVRWGLYMVFGFVLYIDINEARIKWVTIKNLIIYEGLLISLIGLGQLLVLPDFTVLDQALKWDPHQNRLSGLYFDPNFAGIILSLSFCIGISDILNIVEGHRSKKQLPKLLSLVLVIFIAIILTFSRSTWLAVSVVVMILGIAKYRWVIPLACLLVFLVYFAVPRVQTRLSGVTDPSDSFYFRLISWQETYSIAITNPILGYGFNTLRYVRQDLGFIEYDEGVGDRSDSGSDSSLLFVFVTTGIVGLGIFLLSYISLFLDAIKRSRASNFSLLFAAFVLGLLFNSQFINSMFFAAFVVNFSIYTALFYAEGYED